jgi:hypothetical protein
MEKIDITTRFRRDGSLVPIDFSVEDQTIPIIHIGRQWDTEAGKHILVMDQRENTYHLFFQVSDLSWYWIKDIKPGPDSI